MAFESRNSAAVAFVFASAFVCIVSCAASGEEPRERYYAHRVVEDRHGVIAPWNRGQNGPMDERIRIAAAVYKRYPWVGAKDAVREAPHLVYNTHWSIDEQGTITVPPTDPWMCGDLSQRALSIIQGLTAHYAYSGDPLAFLYIPLTVDVILDHSLTRPGDPWPEFPVSTPTRGVGYGRADPDVPNQLDLAATVGTEILRAYRLTGNPRCFEAAKRWGDAFAAHCRFEPGLPPWSRYARPELAPWSDEVTGSITLTLDFLEDLIALGYTGRDRAIVRARDAGRAYLRDQILPRWIENESWGRHYWDWENPVLCGVVPWCCEHFLAHPEAFPSWRTDARNVLGLALNRNSVSPDSLGGVYSGAWAIPESSSCCGLSLSYNQYTYAPAFIAHGLRAGDDRMLEIGRRMAIMASYDSLPNGRVLDGIHGEVVAAKEWLNLAHPWPLCQALKLISLLPVTFAPARENHIVSTSSVISSVVYRKGKIAWTTFDAPEGVTTKLRLAFLPEEVLAEGRPLERLAPATRLARRAYSVELLPSGDAIVTLRHDGTRSLEVRGPDPQEETDAAHLALEGEWKAEAATDRVAGTIHSARARGASARFGFRGNQVRVLADVGPEGGLARVEIDGVPESAPIDCWSPAPRATQVVFSRSGLAPGPHEIRTVLEGGGNPLSSGSLVAIDAIQTSSAEAPPDFGEGGGPRGAQRWILGFAGREDYIDSLGHAWRPGTEFVVRSGTGSDSVAASWWTERRTIHVGETPDPELFRYGVHAKEFWLAFTVGPGRYDLRLLFADTMTDAALRVKVNGREALADFAVAEAAGGRFRAVEKTIPGIEPAHGIIEVRCLGTRGKEASLQAVELTPAE